MIGRLVGGRYRLVAAIGEGGMGTVYRAVHTGMGKDFAVKLLRPEVGKTEEARQRFEREAEAASRLQHPGCVRVTDFGRDGEALFLVMDYLAGRSLAAALRETPRFPPARAVHVASQVLDAMAHAHAQGVVHRDLKPENVMLVTLDGDEDHVKVLDFGLARLAEGGGRVTDTGMVFGTPEYLSPEQILGEPADARADVYAVGVMLWEMLAGRRPFDGETRSALLSAHLTREPPPLWDASGDVPRELDEVVARALRKRKGERWQSAGDFRAALRAVPILGYAPAASGSNPPEPPRTAPLERAAAVVANAPPGIDPAPAPQDASQPPGLASNPPAPATHGSRAIAWGALAAVAALLVLTILALSFSGGTRHAASAGEIDGVRDALRAGDLAGARERAEALAHAYPRDARAFVLLGDVLYAQRDRERGLAAYREASRMDRHVAAAHGELIANLRVTFDDRAHGEAAFELAEQLGAPAAAALQAFAGETRDERLKRRAEEAARRAQGGPR